MELLELVLVVVLSASTGALTWAALNWPSRAAKPEPELVYEPEIQPLVPPKFDPQAAYDTDIDAISEEGIDRWREHCRRTKGY